MIAKHGIDIGIQSDAACDHHFSLIHTQSAAKSQGILIVPGECASAFLDQPAAYGTTNSAVIGCAAVVSTQGKHAGAGRAGDIDRGSREIICDHRAPPTQAADPFVCQKVGGVGCQIQIGSTCRAEHHRRGISDGVLDEIASAECIPPGNGGAVINRHGAAQGAVPCQQNRPGAILDPITGTHEGTHFIHRSKDQIALLSADGVGVQQHLIIAQNLDDVSASNEDGITRVCSGNTHAHDQSLSATRNSHHTCQIAYLSVAQISRQRRVSACQRGTGSQADDCILHRGETVDCL